MQTKTQTAVEAVSFAPFKADTARAGDIDAASGWGQTGTAGPAAESAGAPETGKDMLSADVFAAEGVGEVYLVMALFAGFIVVTMVSYFLAKRFAVRIRE